MADQQVLEQLSKKLSALLALSLIPEPEKRTLAEKVTLLIRFGIPNQDIADILGTSKGTVEVLKSRAVKKKNRL